MTMDGDAERWCRDDALYLGTLLALIALLFFPAWFQPEGMWYTPGATYSDLTVTHWPNWHMVRESVRVYGQVPLWRPSILGGAPHVGNPLAALFYPPNWLALLLPLTFSFHVQYALHALGAGAALYALARWGYGRSPFAAWFGALGYALTPKWIAHLGAGHVGLCQAYAWLPMIAWALRAFFRRCTCHSEERTEAVPPRDEESPGRTTKDPFLCSKRFCGGQESVLRMTVRPVLACAATLALAYLADPRVAFYGAGMAALYGAYCLVGVWRRSGWRAALSLALALSLLPLVFLSLAAVQIVPTAALVPWTTRSAITLQEAGQDSLPWRYLLGYWIADRGGAHEWMTYLGVLPLGLGGLALWRSRGRDRWFWAALALLAVLYALGTNGPLFPLLYRLLPTLGWVRVPSRALLLVVLSANLLAAWGVDVLLAGEWPARSRRWAKRLATGGLLVCGGLGIGFAALYGHEAPAALYASAGIGGAACAAWLFSLQSRAGHVTRAKRSDLRALLLTLLLVDLWPVARSLIELRPPEQVFDEGADVAAYLAERTRPGEGRVYSPSYSVPHHVAARLGIEQLDGVDPVQLSWAAGTIGLAGGYGQQGYSVTQPPFPPGTDVRSAWQEARPNAALLGALNVCFVAAAFPIESPGLVLETRIGETYLYANSHCLPRAYRVARVQPVSGWQEAQEALAAGYNPAQGALVERGPVEGGLALDGAAGIQAATVREHTPNRVVVETEAEAPALLVLADVWAPGWQVTVDGIERPEVRVNGVARGVYLEAGNHRVVWVYRPASLRWGAALSVGTLLVLVVGGMASLVRARSGTGPLRHVERGSGDPL